MKRDDQLKNNVCPNCDHKLDASTDPNGSDDSLPVAGDVSICMYCCAVIRYQDDLSLKEIDENDIAEIGVDFYDQVMQVKSSLTRYNNLQN